ncbi:MAG: periplasmic glucan biosynthesis protein MdoG [Desulfomicrobiaceae bacterium]|nr:periplasmic glucan biosynthesis protein MdoG [Desulfomicrobiaceae bacterium]
MLFRAVLILALCCATHARAADCSWEALQEQARQLALAPYTAQRLALPAPLAQLSYDAWRDIRFRPEESLWRNAKLPFEIQFFHPGMLYGDAVEVFILSNGNATLVPFRPEAFDYGKTGLVPTSFPELAYAGFRVHTPINTKNYKDEFLVFLGASYFRAVARGQHYGISARGLAIDTAEPSGEEFPFFRAFYIQQPKKKDKSITIFALLDSPRTTGAYRFVATPGAETVIDVDAVLYPRATLTHVGLAPLTSMFIFGENTWPRTFDDFRPEVHDSDGLAIHLANGEWIWRPLRNPANLTVNVFEAPGLLGFGLLQRDTLFDHYQDLEAFYHKRPSVWIEPKGDWGPGEVRLVQIPSPEEIHDNIVAYWKPAAPVEAGKPLAFSYRMRWCAAQAVLPPFAAVTATRTGQGRTKGSRMFALDFAGPVLQALPADAVLDASIWVGEGGRVTGKHIIRNPETKGFRVVFEVTTDKDSPLARMLPDKQPDTEMRVILLHGITPISETWSYACKL